jgi:hypothetical protein
MASRMHRHLSERADPIAQVAGAVDLPVVPAWCHRQVSIAAGHACRAGPGNDQGCSQSARMAAMKVADKLRDAYSPPRDTGRTHSTEDSRRFTGRKALDSARRRGVAREASRCNPRTERSPPSVVHVA